MLFFLLLYACFGLSASIYLLNRAAEASVLTALGDVAEAAFITPVRVALMLWRMRPGGPGACLLAVLLCAGAAAAPTCPDGRCPASRAPLIPWGVVADPGPQPTVAPRAPQPGQAGPTSGRKYRVHRAHGRLLLHRVR